MLTHCSATTTGCSVTGTTTTTTVQPPTTRPPCAYPQANAQAKAKRKAKPLTATRVVKPRKLPEPTQYPGGLDQLLATAYTYNGPLISVTWVGYHRTRMVPGVGLVGQSEATHRPFGQLPFILGWNELIGCTVFVAVSPRGVVSQKNMPFILDINLALVDGSFLGKRLEQWRRKV